MFLDISVKDLINVKAQKITYNEVLLNRQDVIKMQKLMQYLSDHQIHFEHTLRLDSLIMTQQNEIGLIFFEYYLFTFIQDGKMYLDEAKFRKMFKDSESLISIINKMKKRSTIKIDNALVIETISTTDLNLLVLNWFHHNYRNFRSIEKHIVETTNLYDLNLNAGHFSKITNTAEFLSLMFTRFVRIRKGSIPFSNDYGSTIKESLQTKSNYFTRKNILEEITEFTQTLTNIYKEDFNLVDISYNETSDGIATNIKIYVTIGINKTKEVKFVLK